MRDGVVEQRRDVVPGEFVDEADLVGVHEARVAHHVAAVGQVDGEDRAAAVLDGAAAVVVELRVVVGADVAAGERRLRGAGRTPCPWPSRLRSGRASGSPSPSGSCRRARGSWPESRRLSRVSSDSTGTRPSRMACRAPRTHSDTASRSGAAIPGAACSSRATSAAAGRTTPARTTPGGAGGSSGRRAARRRGRRASVLFRNTWRGHANAMGWP